MPITLLTTFCFIIIENERFENFEGLCPCLTILHFKLRCQKSIDVILYLSFMVKMLVEQLLRKTNLLEFGKQNNGFINKSLYDCS